MIVPRPIRDGWTAPSRTSSKAHIMTRSSLLIAALLAAFGASIAQAQQAVPAAAAPVAAVPAAAPAAATSAAAAPVVAGSATVGPAADSLIITDNKVGTGKEATLGAVDGVVDLLAGRQPGRRHRIEFFHHALPVGQARLLGPGIDVRQIDADVAAFVILALFQVLGQTPGPLLRVDGLELRVGGAGRDDGRRTGDGADGGTGGQQQAGGGDGRADFLFHETPGGGH